jgi:hypothetical protein
MIFFHQDPEAGDHSAAAVLWSTVEQVPSQLFRQAEAPLFIRQLIYLPINLSINHIKQSVGESSEG